MLEKLAGRIKWERTGDGICVVIPTPFSWRTVLTGLSLWMFCHFTGEIIAKNHHGAVNGSASFMPEWIGLCLGGVWLLAIFAGKQILTLNPVEMKMQFRTLGVRGRAVSVETHRLHNLRYSPSSLGWSMQDESKIQIEKDLKTRNIAWGITEPEALALIGKMMEVYSFPK